MRMGRILDAQLRRHSHSKRNPPKFAVRLVRALRARLNRHPHRKLSQRPKHEPRSHRVSQLRPLWFALDSLLQVPWEEGPNSLTAHAPLHRPPETAVTLSLVMLSPRAQRHCRRLPRPPLQRLKPSMRLRLVARIPRCPRPSGHSSQSPSRLRRRTSHLMNLQAPPLAALGCRWHTLRQADSSLTLRLTPYSRACT
jgi:hypothetical protein